MIKLDDIRNKILLEFDNIIKEYTDIYLNMTYINSIIFKYFYNINRINAECKNTIELNDIVFPLRRIAMYNNIHNDLYFIETKTHIYALKSALFKHALLFIGTNIKSYEKTDEQIAKIMEYSNIVLENIQQLDNKLIDIYKTRHKSKNYLLNILDLYKYKFILENNNTFPNLFYTIAENTDEYIVFEKNIDDTYEYLTEQLIMDNKYEIYSMLMKTKEIEDVKIAKDNFNGINYSFAFNISSTPYNAAVTERPQFNMYSKTTKQLRLDYVFDGLIHMHTNKFVAFIIDCKSDNIKILYFGNISSMDMFKYMNAIYNKLKLKMW